MECMASQGAVFGEAIPLDQAGCEDLSPDTLIPGASATPNPK
jgi:hypothetical protein